MTDERVGPDEQDLNRAIELSNLCILATKQGDGQVQLKLSKADFLLISAGLRTLAFVWGDAMRRHEIAEYVTGTPAEKMERTETVEQLEALAELRRKQGLN